MTLSRHFEIRLLRYAEGAMAPHAHNEPLFCIVLKGEYEETILNRSRSHDAGHMLFCPRGIPHSQRFGKSGATKVLFRPDRLSLDYLADSRVQLDYAPFIGGAEVLAIAPRLTHEIALSDSHSALAAEGLILELIATFARSRQWQPESRAPPWLNRVRDVLDDVVQTAPGLHDLAEVAGRHPVHVAKAFRAYFGETVGGYLRKRKALRAANLLRATRTPLTQIALDCGYGSSSQFSRSFRAVFGLTPSQYRDQR